MIHIGKYDAQTEWAKSNTTFIGLKLNNNTDKDILDWLTDQPSKQGAIKQAIRFYLIHKYTILDGSDAAKLIRDYTSQD